MPTPSTHSGYTTEELTIEFRPSAALITRTVVVPAGTACRKLDDGPKGWVVDDLTFIRDKHSILYSDADLYGIRIAEDKITNIRPVSAEEYARTQRAQDEAMGKLSGQHERER